MRILKTLLALAALVLAAGCTIESDTLLPDPMAAGEAISGLPSDKPFGLETYDRATGTYKAFATLTPEHDKAGIRYMLSLDGGMPNRLAIQARRLSEGNYLIRFSQVIAGTRPELGESGLAFVTVRDGTFYLMTSISDDGWLEEIFGAEALPDGAGTSTIEIDTMDQAARISAWFAANHARLAERRDYVRFRLAR